MNTYISILRGINVSGQKSIQMEALRIMYKDLGFEQVESYVQSGNVIFKTEPTEVTRLAQRISEHIFKTFGFEVPVIVMRSEALEQILDANPYLTPSDRDPSALYVTYFATTPTPEVLEKGIEKLLDKRLIGEEITFSEHAAYLYCPNGYGKTKLTNTAIESAFKIKATTRNIKTSQALLQMAKGK